LVPLRRGRTATAQYRPSPRAAAINGRKVSKRSRGKLRTDATSASGKDWEATGNRARLMSCQRRFSITRLFDSGIIGVYSVPISPGSRFEGYEVLAGLGTGGMGDSVQPGWKGGAWPSSTSSMR
jgi:hypothetical protein